MQMTALVDVDQDISTIDSIKTSGKGTDGYGHANKIELPSTMVKKMFPSQV